MSEWVRLAVPVLAAVTVAQPVHAVQFMTGAQSQRLSFPDATEFRRIDQQAWIVQVQGQTTGHYVLDRVIGKHLYIDYAVTLDSSGKVQRVDILQYREAYGGQVRDPSWLAQFVGKGRNSTLEVGSDIRNISGATLSSEHITAGVKRILARYGG